MARLHQHFAQGMAPIEDGSVLLDQLHTSLEAFNRDREFLDSFEAGETAQMGSFMSLYAHQVPELKGVEGVGLEGVQVHVSSAQVEAVIEFLKKHMPRLVEMIKNFFMKFVDWVNSKVAQLKILSVRVANKLKTLVGSSIELKARTAIDKAALAMLAGKVKPFGTFELMQVINSANRLMGMLSIENASKNNQVTDQFIEDIGNWLTLNHSDLVQLSSSNPELSWDGDYPGRAVFALRSAALIAQEAFDNLPEGMDSLTVRPKDAARMMEQLSQDAEAMGHKVENTKASMRSLLTSAQRHVQSGQYVSPLALKQLKAAPLVVDETIRTITAGLRVRVRLLTAATEMLSRASGGAEVAAD